MIPAVSIVLPTFNREAFLDQAFRSIHSQTWSDWHLIVVDDGSTDRTREVVANWRSRTGQPVEYVYQANRGAAAARNTGLERTTGRYIAFFDSDDVWLPGYLERSVRALDENPDVDWVFGPCRMVQLPSLAELEANTFHWRGRRRLFLDLAAESRPGGLSVIVDPRALEFQLRQGMSCGPQNSVCRRTVFERRRFFEEVKVVEDQLLAICALADRRRFAYFSEPEVIYHVHEDNWSFAGKVRPAEAYVNVFGPFVRVMERLRLELPLTAREARAFRQRIARDAFWQFGYNGLWQGARGREALSVFARSLRLWPWDLSRWKTFVLAAVRLHLGASRP